MKNTSLLDIKQGYNGIKRLAQNYAKNGDYPSAMKHVGHCVTIASQFNWIYADDELEELLDIVAKSEIDTSCLDKYDAEEDNWVFYDDYCTSYVLVLQWMNALTKTGNRVLYITSQFSFEGRRDISILKDIQEMPNVVIDVIPDGNYFDRANYLFRSIVNFKASKVFLHKAMNSLVQLPLCVLPKEVTVYNINLGDQFFWLGVRHIDYNIEFRPFGATVSLQRRGFRKEQLLIVPFYPANENRPFEGFPQECDNKLVIFSGGDYYKTWDKSGTFWRLVKKILDKHQNVVFLFAIKRNPISADRVDSFIKENHFEGRFVRTGRRQDIYQVFAHCDIYMGTCPISGSLMSQLAAINGKPILQYYEPGTPDDETEQALCINNKFPISFNSEEEFLIEADNLINDVEYRKRQGKRLMDAMMRPEQFDKIVHDSIMTSTSQYPIDIHPFDYKTLDKRWLMLERCGFTDVGTFISSLLGKRRCLHYAPFLFMKVTLHQINSSLKH